jgi:hypothetical protein
MERKGVFLGFFGGGEGVDFGFVGVNRHDLSHLPTFYPESGHFYPQTNQKVMNPDNKMTEPTTSHNKLYLVYPTKQHNIQNFILCGLTSLLGEITITSS